MANYRMTADGLVEIIDVLSNKPEEPLRNVCLRLLAKLETSPIAYSEDTYPLIKEARRKLFSEEVVNRLELYDEVKINWIDKRSRLKQSQVNKFIAKRSDPEAAKAFLIEIGLIDDQGHLTEPYRDAQL